MDIKNTDFYNATIEISLFDVCLKIVDITNYYILYSNEGRFKDKEITKKGLDVILNVFSMILLYTKNFELSVEYTNNSIYYFIEYVSQISTKNNEFVFVNLTIKDAILYVYRKSIFEINENYRRKYASNENETLYFDIVNLFVKTYSIILKDFIDHKNYNLTELNDLKHHLYKINAYIITFFKAIEIYTDIEDKDHSSISDDEKKIIYNVSYSGLNLIYNKLFIDDSNNDINNDQKKNLTEDIDDYNSLCEKIKKIIIDYSDSLVANDV